MTYLPQLRDQLAAVEAARVRRRGARTAVLIAVLALVIAAGALAAGGVIQIGSTVAPPARFQEHPRTGSGAAVPSTARLLPLRVEDPAGGPPWGLRLVKTTRGLVCLQPGRVVDGKLGVLGQDGVAHDDGRFHELSLRFATLGAEACAAPGNDGNAFLAVEARGLASGDGPARSCLGPGEGSSERPRCPVADHRRFLYGMLGSEAVGLTYRHKGKVLPAPVAGPEGAYLIVLAGRLAAGGYMTWNTPSMGHPFQRITYRDGSTCPPLGQPPSARRPCPPVGYRSPLVGIDRASLRRPLRVAVLPPPRRGRPLRRLTVSFAAPLAVRDARLSYLLNAHFRRTCPHIWFVPSTRTDVELGERVRLVAQLPRRCHGIVRGSVRLVVAKTGMPALGGPAGGSADDGSSVTIGRFRLDVP
jgi:hypothetical protein